MTAPLLLAAIGGFLLGSIPFGLILTRLAGLGDIRAVGSGNIGATNVLRTGRKDVAALTLLLDGGKGTVAVLLAAAYLGSAAVPVAGLAAVLGHCFCPWLGFRGGKGVATGLGVFIGWFWPVGLACCALWLLAAWLSRRSSAAAIVSFLAAPVLFFLLLDPAIALAALLVTLLMLGRHHANIRRLLAGTEPKIGTGK